MNQLYEKMQRYIRSLGGELGEPVEEPLCRNLPLFVSASYDFCRVKLWGQSCLLLMSKNESTLAPEQIEGQKGVVERIVPGKLLFVFKTGTKEYCKLMIKRHIPFIIPGRQVFFPEIMIALQEDKFSRPKASVKDYLSPMAQVFFLFHLLNKEHGNDLSFQQLQKHMNVNKVYVSRAAKELEQTGIAEIVTVRRMKSLSFAHDRVVLWEEFQKKLVSPVMRQIRTEEPPCGGLLAGVSALSTYSLLEDNADLTYAIYGRGIKLAKDDVCEFSGAYLELWKYDPKMLSKDGKTIDKLSLYLSLKDNPDLRVVGELQTMMETFEW